MPIFLRVNGMRIKVFWLAGVFFLLVFVFLLIFCAPDYRRTAIAYFKAYVWADFVNTDLDNVYGVREYDVFGPVDDLYSSECLRLPWTPSPWVCIHDPEVDRFISGYLKDGSVWESDTVILFQELLERDPDLGVVDIGANIGQYSLLGASLGRSVVAVDARLAHIQMLHHAIVLNGYQHRIQLVHNAVSDTRTVMSLQLSRDNQGATRVINVRPPCSFSSQCASPPRTSTYHVLGITLDDLVDVVGFHKVLLKIDIEGDEAKAILHGVKFLQSLFVPFVIMEWEFMRKSETAGEDLIDMLNTLGYQAHSMYKDPLKTEEYRMWPNDIIWKHRTVDL